MLPFLSTATVMFSGFVCVGMFTALGRSTFTVLLITGMVIRKIMSNTNRTSTRGVVLMFAITPGSSPPDPGPTLIAIIVAPELYPGAPQSERAPSGVTRPQLLADGSGGRGARAGTAHLISRNANAGATHEIGMQI